MVLMASDIQAQLKPYGLDASPELCASIERYIALLLQWNKRISLTTVTDPVEVVRFDAVGSPTLVRVLDSRG
jgi:16S rRNA G527 N7-methylase RsmG